MNDSKSPKNLNESCANRRRSPRLSKMEKSAEWVTTTDTSITSKESQISGAEDETNKTKNRKPRTKKSNRQIVAKLEEKLKGLKLAGDESDCSCSGCGSTSSDCSCSECGGGGSSSSCSCSECGSSSSSTGSSSCSTCSGHDGDDSDCSSCNEDIALAEMIFNTIKETKAIEKGLNKSKKDKKEPERKLSCAEAIKSEKKKKKRQRRRETVKRNDNVDK